MPAGGTPPPARMHSVIERRDRRRLRARFPVTLAAMLAAAGAAGDCATFASNGDRIEAPLAGIEGDAAAGAQVARDRQRGDCTICHQLPLPDAQFHGNLGPDLRTVGARLSAAQIRQRVAANRQLNPESIMPDYCLTADRYRVARAYRDRPILSAREIEDLVVWLSTLGNPEASP